MELMASANRPCFVSKHAPDAINVGKFRLTRATTEFVFELPVLRKVLNSIGGEPRGVLYALDDVVALRANAASIHDLEGR